MLQAQLNFVLLFVICMASIATYRPKVLFSDAFEAINNLFNTWYTNINYATTQSALVIQPLINEVDRDK